MAYEIIRSAQATDKPSALCEIRTGRNPASVHTLVAGGDLLELLPIARYVHS